MSHKWIKRCLEIFARNCSDINPTIYVEDLTDGDMISKFADCDHFMIYGHPSINNDSVRVAFGSITACNSKLQEIQQTVISMGLKGVDPLGGGIWAAGTE